MVFLATFLGLFALAAAIAWFRWRRPILSIAAMVERIVVVGFFVFAAVGCFTADNVQGGLISAALALVLNGFYMIALHRAQKKATSGTP